MPVVLFLVAMGLIGCGSKDEEDSKKKEDAGSVKDTDAQYVDSFDLGNMIDTVTQDVVDVTSGDPQDLVAADLPTDVQDVFVGPDVQETPDVVVKDAGVDSLPDVVKNPPTTPAAPKVSSYMKAPCAYPASLSYDAASNILLTACGGAPNALFRSPALTTDGKSPWTQVGTVGGYPSHHIALSNDRYLVNHSGPDGFTIIDGKTGVTSDKAEFSKLALKGADGKPLGFVPNNPAGAMYAGGKLCVATSNMNHMDMDPLKTTFFPGTMICFPYSASGKIDAQNPSVYLTSGVNATGMALIDEKPDANGVQRFAVLSSNGYAPKAGEEATIDVYSLPAMTHTTAKLGAITAQISPTIAVDAGGMMFIGTQKPDTSLLGVNPNSGAVFFQTKMGDVKNFVASIQMWGPVAAVSDFGVFGVGGNILFVNTDQAGWKGVTVSPLTGAAGPSVVAGDKLYQAVTTNAGDSADIWQVNMGDLK